VWRDDGLHRLGEHGEADLGPVDLEDLEDGEVAEVARSSIYTWEFRNRGGGTLGSDPPTTGPASGRVDYPVRAGDPPPDPAD
jgi:hypothetical protein